MLFKISFLHERATLRMYTWNFKKLTTWRVALWKRKKVIRPSSTVILKKTFWGGKNTYFNKYWNLGISQRFKSQNFFFFLRFIRDNFFYINHLFTVLGSSMATRFQLCIFFFFHYRENVFSNIIMLFDAMWNHNSSRFRSRSKRDIPLFAQSL